jgi:hypothetical protein
MCGVWLDVFADTPTENHTGPLPARFAQAPPAGRLRWARYARLHSDAPQGALRAVGAFTERLLHRLCLNDFKSRLEGAVEGLTTDDPRRLLRTPVQFSQRLQISLDVAHLLFDLPRARIGHCRKRTEFLTIPAEILHQADGIRAKSLSALGGGANGQKGNGGGLKRSGDEIHGMSQEVLEKE